MIRARRISTSEIVQFAVWKNSGPGNVIVKSLPADLFASLRGKHAGGIHDETGLHYKAHAS
jgi:hypothetical protein